ncbi:hypothetical protein GW17_00057356, partial [Ensete ventricosum]
MLHRSCRLLIGRESTTPPPGGRGHPALYSGESTQLHHTCRLFIPEVEDLRGGGCHPPLARISRKDGDVVGSGTTAQLTYPTENCW